MKLDRKLIVGKLNFGIQRNLVEMGTMMDNQVEMVGNQFAMGNQLVMGKRSFVVLVDLRMVEFGSLVDLKINLVVDSSIVVDLEILAVVSLVVDLVLVL